MMRKKWLTLVLLAAIFLFALLLFLLVLRPYVFVEKTTEDATIEKETYEDEKYNTLTLYTPIERAEMQEILIHNESGTYSFKREKFADPSSRFVLSINGKSFSHIDFDDEKFASLVVAVGATYVEERLISKDDSNLAEKSEAEREEIYKKYGLDAASNPNYFEIKSFSKSGGKDNQNVSVTTRRVYVGNATVAGTGYYLRVDNRAEVYVSLTPNIGTVVSAKPAHFANLTLQAQNVEQGSYFMKNVTLWNRISTDVLTVKEEDTITVLYAKLESANLIGNEVYEKAVFDLKKLESIAHLFVGKKVGDVDIFMTIPQDKNGLDGSVYHVKEILAIDSLFLNYSFLNASERDAFLNGVAYKFGAPSSALGYVANSDMCMDIAELMANFEATEILEVGVTDELLEKYGLYRHTLYLEMPQDVSVSQEEGKENDYIVRNYLSNYLYFSDVQEDGTRYVASMLYDVIGKIDADSVDFLDADIFHFVDPSFFVLNVSNVQSLKFDFGYADYDKTFTFDLASKQTSDGKTTFSVRHRENGSVLLDRAAFSEVYLDVFIMKYMGMYQDEERTVEDVKESCRNILSLTVTLNDGTSRTYDFYAYSDHRVLAAVDGHAHFYTLSRHIKKLASDIEKMLDGETPNHEKFY